jgi:hypothetical protein
MTALRRSSGEGYGERLLDDTTVMVSVAELDPALPPDITSRTPLARAWRANSTKRSTRASPTPPSQPER